MSYSAEQAKIELKEAERPRHAAEADTMSRAERPDTAEI